MRVAPGKVKRIVGRLKQPCGMLCEYANQEIDLFHDRVFTYARANAPLKMTTAVVSQVTRSGL